MTVCKALRAQEVHAFTRSRLGQRVISIAEDQNEDFTCC